MNQTLKRKETKEKLKKALPSGFLLEIQEFLSKKGINTSISKISGVCNVDSESWDLDIIEAGFEIARIHEEREEQLHSKVKSL
jgi:hypothetical protein